MSATYGGDGGSDDDFHAFVCAVDSGMGVKAAEDTWHPV